MPPTIRAIPPKAAHRREHNSAGQIASLSTKKIIFLIFVNQLIYLWAMKPTPMNIKQIVAQQIKSARRTKGLSLQALAEALNHQVTRQALHRYEKGEVMPDEQKLVAIGKVLDVSPDYFFRTIPVHLGEIAFSKINHLPQKEIVRVRELTREYLSRYLELEQLLGIKSSFKNPLRHIEPICRLEQVEDAAVLLRKKWHLGDGTWYNVLDVLEDKGVKIVSLRLGAGIQGLQTYVNNTIPVIAYAHNLGLNPCAVRAILLHELGHLLLPFGSISSLKKELMCQRFAEALLLPKNTIQHELGEQRSKVSLLELAALQAQYGLSLPAILHRSLDVGVINASSFASITLRLKQAQRTNFKYEEYQGEERAKRFEQLLFRALTEERITVSKAAALLNCTSAVFRETFLLAV
jgi:transcriptional regulator with XRE-family HTH domain/Zn-dependent peptidase ImmA (M78 family)